MIGTVSHARHDHLQSQTWAVPKPRTLNPTTYYSAPRRVPAALLSMPWVANLDESSAIQLLSETELANHRWSWEWPDPVIQNPVRRLLREYAHFRDARDHLQWTRCWRMDLLPPSRKYRKALLLLMDGQAC